MDLKMSMLVLSFINLGQMKISFIEVSQCDSLRKLLLNYNLMY